uniref:Uncharacterized protein n=1 Tax=Rhipicephalus zambeziensis TaxID=60191 RepID=A0A224YH06_9ACAR
MKLLHSTDRQTDRKTLLASVFGTPGVPGPPRDPTPRLHGHAPRRNDIGSPSHRSKLQRRVLRREQDLPVLPAGDGRLSLRGRISRAAEKNMGKGGVGFAAQGTFRGSAAVVRQHTTIARYCECVCIAHICNILTNYRIVLSLQIMLS